MFILQIAYTRPVRCARRVEPLPAAVVENADDAADGIAFLKVYDFDAVVVELRNRADLDTIGTIRGAGFLTPILVVTPGYEPTLWTTALDAGADDAAMSFPAEETLARLRALVRRRAGHATSRLRVGPLEMNLDRQECTIEGRPVRLPPIEYRLLATLVLRVGRLVRTEEALAAVWGADTDNFPVGVAVAFSRLRRALRDAGAPEMIQNRVKVGWFIAPAAPVECAA